MSALASGCLFHDREGVHGKLVNTDEQRYEISLTIRKDGVDIHNGTHTVDPAPPSSYTTTELGLLIEDSGTYEAVASLADGGSKTRTISYSPEEGPDSLVVTVRDGRISLDVGIV